MLQLCDDTDFELFDGEKVEQAYKLAGSLSIYISNDKEVFEIEQDALGNVIAASFVSFDNADNLVSFDIVVAEAYQGRGLGKRLINSIINFYVYDDMPVEIIEAYCVNPAMVHILKTTFGFKQTGMYDSNPIMRYEV